MRRDYATYTRCGETAGSLREVGEKSCTAEMQVPPRAITRSKRVSLARYTSPIPPAPSGTPTS